MYNFPPSAADVDVQGLDDREFSCAVWRAGDAARDAGAMAGGGRCDGGVGAAARFGCVRVRVMLLLLLQLLSMMPSMLLLQCRALCRVGRKRRMSSPSTLQQEACHINRAMTALSSASAARRLCSLSQSHVYRRRSSACSRRSRCILVRGKRSTRALKICKQSPPVPPLRPLNPRSHLLLVCPAPPTSSPPSHLLVCPSPLLIHPADP